MKMKVLIGALVILIVVNVATIGSFIYLRYARGPRIEDLPRDGIRRGSGRLTGRERPHRMARFHNEHREQLKDLFQEFRSETQDLRLQIHELEGKTFELMQDDPIPTAQIDSLLEEISAVQLSISKAATRKMIEARSFLPPEDLHMFFNLIHGPSPGERGGPGKHRNTKRGPR